MRPKVQVAIGAGAEVVVKLHATARIHGVVTRGGAPVAGAEIAALRPSPIDRSAFAVSQADGTFWLERAPLGELVFVARPYRVVSPATIHTTEPTTYEVALDVARLGSITGRVTRLGHPIAGAQVCCVRDARGADGPIASDADGRFAIRGVAAGAYQLGAQTAEAFVIPVAVTLDDGEDRSVDLELALAGTIAGSVVDETGAAVPGVVVRWLRADGGDTGKCLTDDAGRYRCGALSGGGRYQAAVFPTSAMQTPFPAVDGQMAPVIAVADGNTEVHDVRLAIVARRYAIRGRVVDDGGQPVADARVSALPARDEQPPRFLSWLRLPSTFSDADGTFALGELSPGAYALHAQAATGEGIVPRVTTGTTDVAIQLVRPATIEGSLAGFAAPPTIYARQLAGAGEDVEGVVDGDAFRITGLDPGRYIVDAQTTAEGEARLVELHSGETVRIALASHGRAAIEGHVLDFRTRKPIAGAICHAMAAADGVQGTVAWHLDVDPRSDVAGRVMIDPAPAGSVGVMCMMPADRWSPPTADLVVAAGDHAVVQLYSAELHADQVGTIGVELGPHARITAVQPGSGAAAAGAQVGDAIVGVDGVAVDGLNGFGIAVLIGSHAVGTTVAVVVQRGSERRTLTAKVAPP